ncbi:MAG: beta-propeller fold lactonase family protein [Actinomycetota bacterium]|nr:beta-propeller fold lactonase family protein [Actinomycetota bacterium]
MRTIRSLGIVTAFALVVGVAAQAGPAVAASPPAKAAAVSSVPPRAYVTDLFDGTVSVIDRATNAVIATIPVGGSPWAVAVSPDGAAVYASSTDDSTVAVIDPVTDTVVAVIPVGALPTGIAFTPDSTRAYVVNGQDGTVSVIDTATRTVTTTIALPAGSEPIELGISPDGTRAYVTNSGLDTVSVINTATNTVIADIPVDSQPFGVAVSATRAYVANQNSDTVSVINTATNAVVATIPVGGRPQGVALSPNGMTLFVTNSDSGTLSIIDTATNTVTATLNVGASLSVAATNTRAYIATFNGTVTVVATPIDAVIDTIPISDPDNPSFLFGIAVGPGDLPPPGSTPTISTQASPRTLLNGPVTDTATLAGASNPTGNIIFTLYSDSDCTVEAFSSTNPVTGATTTSSPFIATSTGTFRWRAVYSGDANNNPAAGPCNAPNESVVVAPFAPPPFTRTISGDFTGPVTVGAGESVQLLNARVVGPVTVSPGGALTVVSSQISRGIVANAPGFLSVCGSQVSAPSPGAALTVTGAKVPIRIGDISFNCAGNRFAGDVNLDGNATQTLGSNIVSGNVNVTNGGPGATVIKRNSFLRNLACSGNAPAPTNARQPNTGGTRTGQCARAPGQPQF